MSNVKHYKPRGYITIPRQAGPSSSVEVAALSALDEREEECFMSPSRDSSRQSNRQH